MAGLQITPPKDYSTITDGISQSIMGSWGCRRKMMFVLNRWRAEPNGNTYFGTAFHDCFEGIYKNLKTATPKLINKYLAESQLKEMKPVRSQLLMEKMAEAYKLQAIVFPEYLSFYQKVDAKRDWWKLELEFNYLWQPVKQGQGWRLRGKIDGVFKDKKGKYWIVEHKTKSQINEEVLGKVLTFNFQNLFYIMAVEKQYGVKVSGILYDVIRKPGSKQKVNEPDKEYATRLTKEIRSNHEHYFKRYELFYGQSERKEFEDELAMKLAELDDLLAGRIPVYRNECLCEKPFVCDFLDACSSGALTGLVQKDTLFEELTEAE